MEDTHKSMQTSWRISPKNISFCAYSNWLFSWHSFPVFNTLDCSGF